MIAAIETMIVSIATSPSTGKNPARRLELASTLPSYLQVLSLPILSWKSQDAVFDIGVGTERARGLHDANYSNSSVRGCRPAKPASVSCHQPISSSSGFQQR